MYWLQYMYIDMAYVTDVNCMDIFYAMSNVRVMLRHMD